MSSSHNSHETSLYTLIQLFKNKDPSRAYCLEQNNLNSIYLKGEYEDYNTLGYGQIQLDNPLS